MSKFKVGDKVRVTRDGYGFSTYKNFFSENDLTEFKSGFEYGRSAPVGNYTIVGKGNHNLSCYGPIYVLRDDNGNIFLVGNDKGVLELIEEPIIYASDLMTEARKNKEKYEGKRYKVVLGSSLHDWGKQHYECIIKRGTLTAINNGNALSIFDDTQLEEIKPEPKPVSAKEAADAFCNGKVVICKYPDFNNPENEKTKKFKPTGIKSMCHCDEVTFHMFSKGTWYIEE